MTKTIACTLLGKPIQVDILDGEVSLSTILYQYDEFGRLKSTCQNDFTSTTTYDEFGRVNTCTTMDATQNITQTISTHYDDYSREMQRDIEVSTPNNVLTQHIIKCTYNSENQITHRESIVNDTTLNESFTYDVQNRLESYCVDSEDKQLLPQDEYNNAFVKQDFVFDLFNNLCSVTTAFKDGSSNTSTYEYTVAGKRQVTEIKNTHANYPASVAFTYDLDGNLVESANNSKYQYSVSGRLMTATQNSESISYLYDPYDRIVVTQSVNVGKTNRYYLDDRLAIEMSDKGHHLFIAHQGMPVAEISGDKRQLLAVNNQNSVVSAIELTGEMLSPHIMTYSPYGFRHSNAIKTGFNGEVIEAVTGYYQLGNGTRAYVPLLGLFTAPDSFCPFYGGGIHPYLYCEGNPINYTDPSGHFSSGMDLGLNIFSLFVDLFALGTAVFTGGASIATGIAITGATLGIASDTLGIAADSMAIQDAKTGNTARQDTIQNLGFASGVFGLASLATDVGVGSYGTYSKYKQYRANKIESMELGTEGNYGQIVLPNWQFDHRRSPGTHVSAGLKAKDVAKPALEFIGFNMIPGKPTKAKTVIGIGVGVSSLLASFASFANTTWAPANHEKNADTTTTPVLQDKFLLPVTLYQMEGHDDSKV
ncbi:hypothetical protein AB835_13970 [Candidatus Endobugula sertula]|uniref:Teneurin-like YD-shell domain-containing protein n=1 Tax=Candidatus Endobugula sertula TaxID=62101 RepID=A0A1D2QLM6_9GAMM|nr:hypothetical protein AB835_13970 [Candidatus Endobugula sertula]